MRVTNRTLVIVMGLALVLEAACSSAPPSTGPVTSPSPVGAAPPASATPTPTTAVASTETPAPTPSPSPTPNAKLTAGTIAATVADGLQVRSKPSISDDSRKMEPLLPLGTKLLVLDGPVSASGYDWFDVVPLTSRTLPSGWVASTARDGEAWIEATAFDCPPVPTDIQSLTALAPGVGLACFPQVPITVQARLLECNCDIDGSWYTPSWFFLGSGGPNVLVAPEVTQPPELLSLDDWFALNLDPNGQSPEVLPLGEVVEVTGIFDHPAAASCTRTDMDGEPAPSQGCRLAFAVTKLVSRP